MCAVGGGGSPGKYGTTVRGINETGSPLGTEEPGAHVREHDWSKRGEERRKRERERENIPGNVYMEYFGNGSRRTHCYLQKAVGWKIAIATRSIHELCITRS